MHEALLVSLVHCKRQHKCFASAMSRIELQIQPKQSGRRDVQSIYQAIYKIYNVLFVCGGSR